MPTVIYTIATGELLGHTASDSPGPNQIPDPLPTGTATKVVTADPGHPPVGKTYQWNTSTLDYDEATTKKDVLDPIDFLRMFTQLERIAIRESTNSVVMDFYDLLKRSKTVSLSHADTIAGVNYLEFLNLIASGRAAEILNG